MNAPFVAETAPPEAPSTSSHSLALTVAAAVVAPMVLAACGGGSSDGGSGAVDPGPANTFVALKVGVTAVGTTTVNSLPTTAGATTFTMSGSAPAGAVVKRDPGSSKPPEEYDFTVTATDAGSATTWIRVTVNPAPEDTLDITSSAVRRVRMFHSRVGFGATVSDLERFRGVAYATMIDTVVDEGRSTPVQGQVAWRNDVIPTATNDLKGDRIDEMRRWWFKEMLTTSSPLTERMVLFWHNHFVTAIYDIFEPITSWAYLETLRTYALGNFKTFVEAICINPAMVMFLDNNSNEKGRPNENFARELMELFTLGEGREYTEADIVEVAKSFTGYGLTNGDQFLFKPTKHESTAANYLAFLGRPAGEHHFGAPGPGITLGVGETTVVDIIFGLDDSNHPGHKRVAVYIAEKLWDEFIGGARDATTLRAIASAFQAAWDIRVALKTLFKSAAFMDISREGFLIRSPIELFVGMYRSLEILPETDGQWDALVWMGDGADQQLGQPPNVRGWAGGTLWITSKNYMNRRTYVADWKFGEIRLRVPSYLATVLTTLLLPIPPVVETVDPTKPIDNWTTSPLRACLRDPAIHLR